MWMTSPESGCRSPARHFNSVDLPSPLRPTSAVFVDGSMEKETLSRIGCAPKEMEASCTRSSDMFLLNPLNQLWVSVFDHTAQKHSIIVLWCVLDIHIRKNSVMVETRLQLTASIRKFGHILGCVALSIAKIAGKMTSFALVGCFCGCPDRRRFVHSTTTV